MESPTKYSKEEKKGIAKIAFGAVALAIATGAASVGVALNETMGSGLGTALCTLFGAAAGGSAGTSVSFLADYFQGDRSTGAVTMLMVVMFGGGGLIAGGLIGGFGGHYLLNHEPAEISAPLSNEGDPAKPPSSIMVIPK